MPRESTREAAVEEGTRGSTVPTRGGDRLLYESRISYEEREEVAVTIVDVISEVRNRPVSELVSRIDEAVDPDALDRIVRPLPDGTPRTGWVTFRLCDCTVRLSGDGLLHIYGSAEEQIDVPVDSGDD